MLVVGKRVGARRGENNEGVEVNCAKKRTSYNPHRRDCWKRKKKEIAEKFGKAEERCHCLK